MNNLPEIVDNILFKLYEAYPSQRGFRPIALFRDYCFTPIEMERVTRDCLELQVLQLNEANRLVITKRGYEIMKEYKSWKNYTNSMVVIGGYDTYDEITKKENEVYAMLQQVKYAKWQARIAFAALIITIAVSIMSILRK